jgi:hypothetical protein
MSQEQLLAYKDVFPRTRKVAVLLMSSQRKNELAVPLDGSEQVLSTAGVKAAYFAVALGYLMGVLAARHLTGGQLPGVYRASGILRRNFQMAGQS